MLRLHKYLTIQVLSLSKEEVLTRASKTMNLLPIFVVIATSAILAVNGYEFQSQKLNQTDATPSLRTNQFYEGIFRARLDHFRPLNQERVEFVSPHFTMKLMKIVNFFRQFRFE